MDHHITFSKWKPWLTVTITSYSTVMGSFGFNQKQTIVGSLQATDYLLDKNKKVFLLTNASARSRDDLLEKIKSVHNY